MTSKRFPGKSLMKIAGFPLVVLSALRAGNTGIRVVIVTSTDSSDDVLFDEVSSYGIECFRGNLNNVLHRFKEAADYLKLSQDSIIIRLTGDNVVPDGGLINDLIGLYVNNSKINYIGANYPHDNLPYGVNAELFKVSSLRDACFNASSDYDLENVTPIYTDFEGWSDSVMNATTFTELPDKAKEYIDFLSQELETPIKIISVGPKRDQILLK